MMIKNFVIPLNKDELLTSHAGQYFVEEITPLRTISQALNDTRAALQTQGADFILHHFDFFFSIVVHGDKVQLQVTVRAFGRILKAIEMLINDMEKIFDEGGEMSEDDRLKFLCTNKMYAYLFSWFISYINEKLSKNAKDIDNVGKRKKATKTDMEEEWDGTAQKALELLYRWLQLPLHKMWQPPIVEDSFVTVLTQVCYKLLEQNKDFKSKYARQTIFEIMGTLIKKYNQGITCVVRIIQLVKLYDVLAAPIANGIVHIVMNCGCNGMIREVVKEIGQSELGEADSRNISTFFETIATSQPNLILPILDDIMDYLASEFYCMRNCVIGVLGAVVQKVLTGEELTDEQKETRDECLDNLEDHILDCHAYVRSKVLQTWQQLCCEGAVPLARQGKLLAATALRLEDKSANVRKQALQLLRALLQGNPFAAKLNREEISKSLEIERAKLKEMQTKFASSSMRGDKHRLELWQTLLPKIREALQHVLENKGVEEKDGEEDEENTEADDAFEHVRQLLLNEKVNKAVAYLQRVCTKLECAPKMDNLSVEAKEECLFLFLLKIFMESENASDNSEQNTVNAEETESHEKQKEEIKAKKRVVSYFKNCLKFATELENAIPMAENLLFSTTASDAVEACTLLGTAYQFGVAGAANAIQKALFQVFHRDQSVRNNVALVYKQIYLDYDENQRSERQKALLCVKKLIDLFKTLQPGQSPALAQLLLAWYNEQELNNEVLQVLWENFSMKSPDITPLDSRVAIMLITMIAPAQSGIISGNLDVLVKIGFGPRAKTDLLLARDTCRALLQIKQDKSDTEKAPIRYANDHEMFKEILTLLKDNFTNTQEDGYISFATDGINAIYHLANQPDHLMKELIIHIFEKGLFTNNDTEQESVVSSFLLSKFLYIIGHVAIKQMVHLDTNVYKELKRRNAVRELRKSAKSKKAVPSSRKSRKSSVNSTPSSAGQTLRNKETSVIAEDNGEEALEGAADDADAEFVNATLENEVVTGDGLLTKFVPLVLEVCQHPEKYQEENLQAAGALALSKMMTVSCTFCEESLQLLVTILERSTYPSIRASVLMGLSDLTTRFPNQVEPWTKHIYGRLRDEDTSVRSTCVRMLSNLVMKEMVRVKGQVSELALCIVDEDEQIRENTRQFFNDLSQKGNALYNVMPDILSRLADPELNLEESNFQEILKFILGLLQKERQIDTIIEKICARFKLSTTERQWRDLSYCLSLLQFNGKSIRRLIESLPLLKDKIHHEQVLKALQSIIDQTKKRPDAKAACVELEEKIQELLEGAENSKQTDSQIMPPPPVPRRKKNARNTRHKSSSEEDEEDSDSESDPTPISKVQRNKGRGHKSAAKSSSDSDSDDSDDIWAKTSAEQSKRTGTSRKLQSHKEDTDSLMSSSPLPKRNKLGKTPTRATPTRATPTRATPTRRVGTRTSARLSK
ncbi:hypothetical protein KM043_007797 [Ampulex compressa]|nr:hypothetical protein KM043_007797 [Ampulex compressa]